MDENSSQSVLDSLFADRQPVDLDLLAETVRPYIQLYQTPPSIDFTDAWEQLTVDRKILAYLLGRKALSEALKGDAQDEALYIEKAMPGTIEAETCIAGGSVRPNLGKLRQKRMVKNLEGYFVPNNALPQVSQYMRTEKEQQ